MLELDLIEMLCADRDVEHSLGIKMAKKISQLNKHSTRVMVIDVSSFKIYVWDEIEVKEHLHTTKVLDPSSNSKDQINL